jgi:hypothetical protein
MALSKEQEDLYKKTMQEAKRQLEGVDALIEKELQKVRERLSELQESKKRARTSPPRRRPKCKPSLPSSFPLEEAPAEPPFSYPLSP